MGYGWLTVTPVARVPVIYHIFFTALETKENGHCSTLRVRPEQSGMILGQVKVSDGPIWIFFT